MILLVANRELRRGCGGALRGIGSVLLEIVLSGLAAPMMMVSQSACVLGTLLGRDVGWHPQRRDDGSIPLGQVVRHYGWHTAFGVGLGLAAYLVAVPLFLWMSPVILGLVLAIPIAAITARRGAGDVLRKLGLLLIPEETRPPAVLQRAHALTDQLRPTCEPMEAVHRLMSDPRLLDAHRAMVMNGRRLRAWEVEPDRLIGLAKLEDTDDARASVGELTPREKAALLADATGLQRLLTVFNQQPAFSRR
jgi:membrane glycosyltransferase